MKPKILHKHRPYELKITQEGKQIIVETLTDLKNKKNECIRPIKSP